MNLRHPALAAFAITAAFAAEPNESNLTLLDTVSPPIRDLAAEAGDATTFGDVATYDSLRERNKIGVFFSEAAMDRMLGTDRLLLQLLKRWEEKSRWTRADFLHSSTGPMFFMNDGRYQALAVNDPAWYPPAETLTWRSSSSAATDQFKTGLNNASAKVQVYQRFEFPTSLNYEPQGSGIFGGVKDYDTDRAEVSTTARKLVIVIHGWAPEPDADPYADGNWPALMKNLRGEIQGKSAQAPNWDLYAYRWSKDAYTGPRLVGSQHAAGGIGLGVENGTQAAEIGYQHGLVLGKLLRERGVPLEKVHFIAHSAGTWVARSASRYLHATKGGNPLVQQITLLDPYNPGRAWVEDGSKADVDNSMLNTSRIEGGWAGVVAPQRAENIYSVDTFFLVGTNEMYGSGFVNLKVGASLVGWAPADNWAATSWDDHGGPINFYAYTVDPSDKSTSSLADRTKRHGDAAEAGWEHALFMEEYKAARPSIKPGFNFNLTLDTGFAVSTPPVLPRGPARGPQPGPGPESPWARILVDVDATGWVRAMLMPRNGGAAEMAGPVRLKGDGTFEVTLTGGGVLSGEFDTSASPPALTLALDGESYGANQAAQGVIGQRGFDVEVNAAGNLVFSAVLADGTAGLSVARDGSETGWQASGVGTVAASGAFTVAGADGLQVTGQLLANGGLDTAAITVTPPQVPEIHVQDAAGASLTAGASSSDLGSVQVGGGSSTLSLTIRNTGTVALTDLGVTVDGTHSGDFVVSALGITTLAPDASAILNVTFAPGAAGSRTARLRIASNDANENPFELTLTGSGFTATPLAGGGTSGTLTAGAEDFYRVAVPGPGILIVWSEGGTDTHGTLLSSGGVVLAEDNDSDLQTNFRASTVVAAGDYFLGVKGGTAAIAGPYTVRSRFIPSTAPREVSFLEKAGDDLNLGFTNTEGDLYRIERSDDLNLWGPIATVVGTGAEMLVPFPGLGYEATGFFRVGFIAGGFDPNAATGIDLPGAAVTSGGEAGWFTQTTTTQDGNDAARSGLIHDGQSSSISLTATGPGTVSFSWKVSSGAGDFLRFFVNGVEQGAGISGAVDWQRRSFVLGAGPHTLRWTYSKNSSGSAGLDCGWLDQVAIGQPEIVVEQPVGVSLADGDTIDFGTLAQGCSKRLTFIIRNAGGADLSGLSVSASGSTPWMFNQTQPSAATLVPGASGTFTVIFSPYPGMVGPFNAVLRIASNDADENPFDLTLTGSMGAAETYQYRILDDKVAITGYNGEGGAVVIPAGIHGLPVTAIENFHSYYGPYGPGGGVAVTSVTIPASVTSIGQNAFAGSYSLEAITVDPANPAYTIVDGVLYDKNLTHLVCCPGAKAGAVIIPGSVTQIGPNAFMGCGEVTTVEIPAGVQIIGELAFVGCSSLTGIVVPRTVTAIGRGAFAYCESLTSITVDPLNRSYRSVDGILYDKSGATLIQCPGGMTGSVAVPVGVTEIAESAFSNCGAVTAVTLPNGLTRIGNSAFSPCVGLAAVTIPNGLTSLGMSAFERCTGLTSVTLPGSLAIVPDFAFSGCTSLAGIAIPSGITSVGFRSFYDCSSLTEIALPSGITSIGGWAFYECSGLLSLSIPATVTNIGEFAFGACTSLTSVSIPASVTSIGSGPFAGCESLPAITVNAANPNYTDLAGVLFNKSGKLLIQCPAGRTGSYTVPGGTERIGRNGFGFCTKLSSIVVPASVTAIEDAAFLNCASLSGLVFLGNAPSAWGGIFGGSQLPGVPILPGLTVYFLPGSTGFTTPLWNGVPAEPLATDQEIAVSGPAGRLISGSGQVHCGKAVPGASQTRTITLFNAGRADLTGLALEKSGTHAAEFTVNAPGISTLAPQESTTFTVVFAPAGFGNRSASIRLSSNDADENPFVINLLGYGHDPSLGVADGIDLPGTTVTHAGVANWFWDDETTYDGIDSARSGAITDNQSSSFSLAVTGPGTVAFRWKVSSEGGYDYLRFFIDDVEQQKISGETEWALKTYALGPGQHTLRWSYTKDEVYNDGADCGWVDQVVLPNSATPLEAWRQTHFGITANTGSAADDADPDRDGLSNLLEFAFGLSPLLPSADWCPNWQQSGNSLICTFTQPPGVTGVTYGAEWSPSLVPGSWQPIIDIGTAPQHRFSVPMDASQTKFVRLKVTVP